MTKKTRLSDLQLVMLSHAAKDKDSSMLPLPEAATHDEDRTAKDLNALLRRGLLAEIEVKARPQSWRSEDDQLIGLQLTEAALEVLGLSPEEAGGGALHPTAIPVQSSSAPRAGSKSAAVLALLQREQGATLDEMAEATGWLPHTTRAALTGLKKKGHTIARDKRGETTCYCIATSA
jgi:hypothetical protein